MLFISNNNEAKSNEYRLIILSIRDEQYERPTRPPAPWLGTNPSIFGPIDMAADLEGGTWLGLNRQTNKIGFVLRTLQSIDKTSIAPNTRGFLVPNFLNSTKSSSNYSLSLVDNATEYPAYTFVGIDVNNTDIIDNRNIVSYFNNIESDSCPKSSDQSGVYAFGNNLPGRPWTKTEIGQDQFKKITSRHCRLSDRQKLANDLFLMASDDTQHYPDPELDLSTRGYEPEVVPGFSSINCKIPQFGFGSRTQTIILVDNRGKVDWIERNLTDDNLRVRGNKYHPWPVKNYRLSLNTNPTTTRIPYRLSRL